MRHPTENAESDPSLTEHAAITASRKFLGSFVSFPARLLVQPADLLVFAAGLLTIGCYCIFATRGRIMWGDEVFGWKLVSDPSWRHMLQAWRVGADGGGLGFYVLCRIWLALFGHALLTFRLFSAAACFAGFWAMWRVLQRFYRPWISVFSLLLVWFSSDTILFQMVQTRFYGMLLGAGAFALLAGVRSAEETDAGELHRLPTLLLVAVAHLLLIESHPFGLLYSGVLLVGSLAYDAFVQRSRWLFYAAAVMPWTLLLLSREAMVNSAKVGKPWFWTVTPHHADLLMQYSNVPFPDSLYWSSLVVFALLVLPPTRLRLRNAFRSRGAVLWPAVALFLTPVLLYILSKHGTSYFVDRYLIPFTLGVAILLAEVLTQLDCLVQDILIGRVLLCVLALAACGQLYWNAWTRYADVIIIPPRNFIPALDASVPRGLPVVVERIDDFIILLQQPPQPSMPLHFLLDWSFATAPTTPRGFVSGYNEIANLNKAGYTPGMVDDVNAFLASHNRFILLHDSGLHWLGDKVLDNPQWSSQQLGDTGPGPFAMSIWLVERRDISPSRPAPGMQVPKLGPSR